MSEKKVWNKKKVLKKQRLESVNYFFTDGKQIKADNMTEFLQTLLYSGDTVVLEGNNQKQASFLSSCLSELDAGAVNNLHMIIPSVSMPEHIDLFEKGVASVLDFSYAGSQSLRIAQMINDEILKVGAIHTYVELYSRLFVDLIPDICLVAADKADYNGNLYTGNNTEETPTIVESTAFKDGIVIVQVNEICKKIDRVDIPGDWVDCIVVSPEPYSINPLFTRDPQKITESQILIAMLCIKGIYAKHEVKLLNHGIGYNTAAIELLLPTYGEQLGLKGKICTNWVLNPHPTLIPAIEKGWVKSIFSFGGELGMENYIRHRSDVFFTGRDGSLRSNRMIAQMAGLYAIDLFIGSTLQIDSGGNSSTVTNGRLSGFGGAPNMGNNPNGRRHSSVSYESLRTDNSPLGRGRKLVVQAVETFKGKTPVFVERLDAIEIGKDSGLPFAPVMIYGNEISHIVTEQGIAYLYKTDSLEERKMAISAIAGETSLGRNISKEEITSLRERQIVAYPQDTGVKVTDASRNLLAAQNIKQLVEWSGDLYEPPAKFKNW